MTVWPEVQLTGQVQTIFKQKPRSVILRLTLPVFHSSLSEPSAILKTNLRRIKTLLGRTEADGLNYELENKSTFIQTHTDGFSYISHSTHVQLFTHKTAMHKVYAFICVSANAFFFYEGARWSHQDKTENIKLNITSQRSRIAF